MQFIHQPAGVIVLEVVFIYQINESKYIAYNYIFINYIDGEGETFIYFMK